MSTVHPQLARFAATLSDAFEKALEEAPEEFIHLFGPLGLVLTTEDGVTARFYEDGIEFYPKEEA